MAMSSVIVDIANGLDFIIGDLRVHSGGMNEFPCKELSTSVAFNKRLIDLPQWNIVYLRLARCKVAGRTLWTAPNLPAPIWPLSSSDMSPATTQDLWPPRDISKSQQSETEKRRV
jgi:hypothetical protein